MLSPTVTVAQAAWARRPVAGKQHAVTKHNRKTAIRAHMQATGVRYAEAARAVRDAPSPSAPVLGADLRDKLGHRLLAGPSTQIPFATGADGSEASWDLVADAHLLPTLAPEAEQLDTAFTVNSVLSKVAVGQRLRLSPGAHANRWWTVAARSERYLVLFRKRQYSVVDLAFPYRHKAVGPGVVRSSLNSLGGGWDIGAFGQRCHEVLDAIESGQWEMSDRRLAPVDSVELGTVDPPKLILGAAPNGDAVTLSPGEHLLVGGRFGRADLLHSLAKQARAQQREVIVIDPGMHGAGWEPRPGLQVIADLDDAAAALNRADTPLVIIDHLGYVTPSNGRALIQAISRLDSSGTVIFGPELRAAAVYALGDIGRLLLAGGQSELADGEGAFERAGKATLIVLDAAPSAQTGLPSFG